MPRAAFMGIHFKRLHTLGTRNNRVRYLVEHGADVNAQGGFYGNPLQAAVTKNTK
jgi:ankyrin repeat protein